MLLVPSEDGFHLSAVRAKRFEFMKKDKSMVKRARIEDAEALAGVPRARGNPLAFLFLGAHIAGSFCLL